LDKIKINKNLGGIDDDVGGKVIKAIYIAPKMYAFQYITPDNKIKHHFRGKGVSNDSLAWEDFELMDKGKSKKFTREFQMKKINMTKTSKTVDLDHFSHKHIFREETEKEVNKTPEELINTVQTSGNHYTVTSNKTKINHLIDQVSSYKDVTNLMQKYGVFQPLAQLFQSGVQTPWGSLNLDMYNAKLASLPTKATRPDGTTYNPQAKAREISQLIYELNQNVMKAAKGIYGPNISNSDAIEMAKSGFKPDDPAQFIANYAAKMGVINEYNGYIASAYRKYAKTHKGAEKADFFDPDVSPEYKILVKNFDTKYSSLLNTLR
jgi:hypothetical protein